MLVILKTAHIQVKVFWVVMPCNIAVGYQCFRGPCCLHSITTQKILTCIFITVKTSNLSSSPHSHSFHILTELHQWLFVLCGKLHI